MHEKRKFFITIIFNEIEMQEINKNILYFIKLLEKNLNYEIKTQLFNSRINVICKKSDANWVLLEVEKIFTDFLKENKKGVNKK